VAFHNVKKGNRLDVKVQYRNIGDVVYVSKVLDILDEKNFTLAITMPTRADKALSLLPNKKYDVTVYVDQAMIVFDAYFEGYIKKDKEKLVALRLSNEGYKIQRREFFRFSCSIPMNFTVIDFEEGDLAAEIMHEAGMTEMHEAVVKDIGGGGLRFMTDSDLSLEYLVECTITLGSITLKLRGRILEKQYLPKAAHHFQYRVLFTDISKSSQEDIINFIFAEQRKQRKTVPQAGENA